MSDETPTPPVPPPQEAAAVVPVKESPPKKRRGAKSKLTPQVQDRIVGVLKICGTVEDACVFAGIALTTFWNWRSKGEVARSGIYKDFLDAVEGAIVERRLRREKQIEDAGRDKRDKDGNLIIGDWRATAWQLERTEPKRYAPRVVVHVQEELTDAAKRLEEEFKDEPELLERAVSAILRGHSRVEASGEDEVEAGQNNPGGEAVLPPPTEPKAGDVPPA